MPGTDSNYSDDETSLQTSRLDASFVVDDDIAFCIVVPEGRQYANHMRRRLLRWQTVTASCFFFFCMLGFVAWVARKATRQEQSFSTNVEYSAEASSQVFVISWMNHPNKCLDVTGSYTSNGNAIQTWDCHDHPDMLFKIPAGNIGLIQWAAHPEFCLDAPVGPYLQLWKCAEAKHENIVFEMPSGGNGPIRLAEHPERCLGRKVGKMDNGLWVQICDCTAADADMVLSVKTFCKWSIWSEWSTCSKECSGGTHSRSRNLIQQPANGMKACVGNSIESKDCNNQACSINAPNSINAASSISAPGSIDAPDSINAPGSINAPSEITGATQAALIAWADHREKCLDVVGGIQSNGNVLQSWDCHDHDDMVFLVPSTGAGLVHWAAHPDFCLNAPDNSNLQLWNHNNGTVANMLFILPPPGRAGPIKLVRSPEKCLGVVWQSGKDRNGRWLQAWNCNSTNADMKFIIQTLCVWKDWSSWSECSEVCGGGKRRRTREILYKVASFQNHCHKHAFEESSCNMQECPAALKPAFTIQERSVETIDDCPDCDKSLARVFIAWQNHPTKCLGVTEGFMSNGDKIRLLDCHDHPDMVFLVKIGGIDFIRSAKHPTVCLNVRGGRDVEIRHCDGGNQEHTMFTVPLSGRGPITVGKQPDKCLSVTGDSEGKHQWLQIRDCSNGDSLDLNFVVQAACQWSHWSRWSGCSKTCGGGQKHRTRKVARKETNGGPACKGETTELRNCSTQECSL